MFLDDVVKKPVATVGPGFTVCDAARLMVERNVGALVIIDPVSRPVGIVTDRDLVVLLAEGVDPRKDTIGCFVGQMLRTASVGEGIRDVTERMHKHGIRRLPVVDAEGQLAGIVSFDDILLLLGKEMGDIAEAIENELSNERVLSELRSQKSLRHES